MALSITKDKKKRWLKLHLPPAGICPSSSRVDLVRFLGARGGLGACSAHAQWATLMRADTLHVVSVVTVLSNVTFKDSRFFFPSLRSLEHTTHWRPSKHQQHTDALTWTQAHMSLASLIYFEVQLWPCFTATTTTKKNHKILHKLCFTLETEKLVILFLFVFFFTWATTHLYTASR